MDHWWDSGSSDRMVSAWRWKPYCKGDIDACAGDGTCIYRYGADCGYHQYPQCAGNVPAYFEEAFDFKAIFGAFAGSAMMQGIRRGLYSNEAGIGSAPNASASANVSHPVKQGLVQMLSVFIDTLLLCTATAMMCMSSGIDPTREMQGAPWVQASLQESLGAFGPVFITVAMVFLRLQHCLETVSIATIF